MKFFQKKHLGNPYRNMAFVQFMFEIELAQAIEREERTKRAPQDQWMQLNLSEDDIEQTKQIASMYRNQWREERTKRAEWLR